MLPDISEMLENWIDEMLVKGYTRDDIASAIELKKMAFDEDNEDDTE